MGELTDISRFRWLTVWLADNLVPEDITKVRTLLKEPLKGVDTGDDALAILDELIKQNRVHDEETGLLRALFISLGRMDLLEAVNDYEREKQTIARKLNKNSSSLGGPYFGRHDMLNKVISVLDTTYDHTHGVCISGEEGIGKTRLAQEACVRMKGSHQLVTVDLNGFSSIESVYYAIMHAFGVECREYQLENLYGLLRGYESAQYGTTILLLDNANSVLNPGSIGHTNKVYKEFIETTKTILTLPNPKVKIIMTSHFDLDISAGFSSKSMSAIRLNKYNGLDHRCLDTDAAVRMFRYHAGNTPVSYEDAKEVTTLCGRNPLVIKILANRLQDDSVLLQDMLPSTFGQKQDITKSLSRLTLGQNDQLQQCLKSSFQSIPKKHQLNMIKLVSIPGSFSLEAARKILKYRKKAKDVAALQYDLLHLKYLGMLEIKKSEASNQFSDKVAMYTTPVSLRAFITDTVQTEAGDDLKAFYKAQNRVIQLYGKKLRDICKLLQSDVCSALSQLRCDLENYLGFLGILKNAEDFKPSENLWWVFLAVELLYSPGDAQDFYRHLAEQANLRNDMHAYADLKCFEIMCRKELGDQPTELLQQLKEVQDILNRQVDSSGDVRSKQYSLANCYHLRGVLLTQTREASEAIQWLQQAVNLRKQLLGEGHFLVARAIHSLGVAMKVGGSAIDAKRNMQQAYEMCRRLANGSDKHLDIPRYIADIADIHLEMGRYQEAIDCMNRSIQLESALGMGGNTAICRTQEKIVTSYSALERYDDAITVAKLLTETQKKLSGHISPKTSHVVYLLGSTCLKARSYQDARTYLTEALEIEEALWERRLPHSDDWQSLKTSIETMMVTLQKQSTLTSYRKRFQDAEDESRRGRLNEQAEGGYESDSSSNKSSLPSENDDELPGSISSENEDELPGSLSSENEDELPGSDSSDDEIPAATRLAQQDSDDETSSNSSSLPSEISDEFPVRVDKNLNNIDKQNAPNQTPEKKQLPPAGLGDSPGDSAVESVSGPSSDEMTPPKNKVH